MFDYSDVIGVPFQERGRDKKGFDCLGLHLYLMAETGRATIECDSAFGACAAMEKAGMKLQEYYVPIEQPEPWCIVAMWGVNPRYTTHIGTVLPNCRDFIHVRRGGSVMIDRLDGVWKTKITGYYKQKSRFQVHRSTVHGLTAEPLNREPLNREPLNHE